jgi:hypothetical protein
MGATFSTAMRDAATIAAILATAPDTRTGFIGVVRYPSHTDGHADHAVRVTISRKSGYAGRVPAGTAYSTCTCAAYVDGHRPCYAMLNVSAAIFGVVPLGSYLWTGARRPAPRGE